MFSAVYGFGSYFLVMLVFVGTAAGLHEHVIFFSQDIIKS